MVTEVARRYLMDKILRGLTNIHPSNTDYILKTSLTSLKSEMDGWTISLSIKSLLCIDCEKKYCQALGPGPGLV